MPRFAVLFLIVAAPLLTLAPGERSSPPLAAVVINPAEDMHSRSTSTSDVVSQALLGTNVIVLATEKNSDGEVWYDVETPDTYKGWIFGPSLRVLKPGDKSYASQGRIFEVTDLLANIYREPDTTKHKPVKVAPISSVLEIVREKDERWAEIVLPCGTKAWIQKGDGAFHEGPMVWPRRTPEEMVALSERFIGLPYLWGGTSPFGLDCSGFVQLIYKMSGIPILRDADIQFKGSGLLAVMAGDETAGDLVFFGSAKNKIGHVGMMINREQFISATVHEKPVVQVSNLKDAYWQRIYQGARRAKR
ncbi:MAG: SH3 domain-containing C40 family peptidase [Candidatus Aminicenantales bacterium]|jgi:cell wall-associated NlpC family hydrolase